MPAIAAKVSPFLSEMFELFNKLCQYKHREGRNLPDISSTHLTVAVYSYFHRLYGMFPCNFLFYMRQQDYDANNYNSVFNGKKFDPTKLFPVVGCISPTAVSYFTK